VKKNITKYQGQGQKGEYKILVVSRDKKGKQVGQKRDNNKSLWV
jgi:hypothetical protein